MFWLISGGALLMLALAATFIKPSEPEHYCRLCGKSFNGPYALDMAEGCESDHIGED